MAGKKMNDDRGEKVAANDAGQRTRMIWFLANIEYAGKAATGAAASCSAIEVCSSGLGGIGG